MLVAATSTIAAVDWHHGDIGTGWWIVMMIGMGLFWVAVFLGIAWVVRAAGGARRPSPGDVLAERLARGEIDVDEYERRCAALVPSGGEPPRTTPPAAVG